MGFLVYTLGSAVPKDGRRISLAEAPLYVEQHPKDTYGNALIVPAEFFADDQSEPAADLPAADAPQ